MYKIGRKDIRKGKFKKKENEKVLKAESKVTILVIWTCLK